MFMNSSFEALRGRRILVVEDEPAIAGDVGGILRDLGCRVVGPAPCTREAFDLLEMQTPDAALLDLDLDGESAVPVAEALVELRVPFVVVSCEGAADFRARALQQAPWIDKPHDERKILLALICALSRSRTRFSLEAG